MHDGIYIGVGMLGGLALAYVYRKASEWFNALKAAQRIEEFLYLKLRNLIHSEAEGTHKIEPEDLPGEDDTAFLSITIDRWQSSWTLTIRSDRDDAVSFLNFALLAKISCTDDEYTFGFTRSLDAYERQNPTFYGSLKRAVQSLGLSVAAKITGPTDLSDSYCTTTRDVVQATVVPCGLIRE